MNVSTSAWSGICSIVLLTFSNYVNSEPLSMARALELARDNNPQYLSARANMAAADARHAQAVSQMFPQLSVTANWNWSHRNYETLEPLFPTPTEKSSYDSQSRQLNLTQPLYRRAAWAAIAQSRATMRQSELELLAAEQEVLLKLAETWFDIITAKDSIDFSEAQIATASRQLDQFVKASQVQLASRPELEDARAKYEQALADRMAADLELQGKLATLEEVVGPVDGFVMPTLRDTVAWQRTDEHDFETFLQRVENENPAVLAAQAALRAASAEVSKQYAGHEPTIDIVGNYGNNRQGSGNFPGQSGYDIQQRSIGVQVSVPIYSGGVQQARVAEAMAMRRRAAQDVESAVRTARSNARLAWYRSKANEVRLVAWRQSLHSYQLALRTATAGTSNGLKFDIDVLRAKQDYLQAVRDSHKAQAEMLVDSLRLRAVAGALTDADILALDAQTRSRNEIP